MPAARQIGQTPCSVSDHYYVDLIFDNLSKDKGTYGPEYWKCNASVLSDPKIYPNVLSKMKTDGNNVREFLKRWSLNIPAEFLHD